MGSHTLAPTNPGGRGGLTEAWKGAGEGARFCAGFAGVARVRMRERSLVALAEIAGGGELGDLGGKRDLWGESVRERLTGEERWLTRAISSAHSPRKEWSFIHRWEDTPQSPS